MNERFQGTPVTINGEEYVLLEPEIFCRMFVEVSTLSGVRKEVIDKTEKAFLKALRIKKKRLRHKKLKEMAQFMIVIMLSVNELSREELIQYNIIEA